MMTAKLPVYQRDGMRTQVIAGTMVPMLTHDDPVMLVGSCFTEHIGNRLAAAKFTVNLNPFGIVYNPLSTAAQLECLIEQRDFDENDLVFHNGLWHSWMHHGRFSHPDAAHVLLNIREQSAAAADFLRKARLLVLTFGTAEAFYLTSGDRLVSNCHKLPADRFYSGKPDPGELATRWISLINSLRKINPDIRICLTISPVRYFKNGPFGNQLSKSILFLFISRLISSFPDLYYFPAYEIFMDDLRDYRFYDEDLMHPGSPGVAYVWDKFCTACIDPAACKIIDEIGSLQRALHHRPSGHATQEHQRFLEQLELRIDSLSQIYPFLDFSEERQVIRPQTGSHQP